MENRIKKTHNPQPLTEDIEAFLKNDFSKQFLQQLQKNSSDTLANAVSAAQNGNFEEAYAILKPHLDTQNASRLVEMFNRKRG